jgi:acetyl-CoA acetyltransferase family protein
MSQRIAIIDGLRSPFCKASGALKNLQADDLGAIIARELMARSELDIKDIDDVIIGNVAQPAHCANIARIVALKTGIPQSVPAVTVHRNCASGMESVTTGAERLLSGRAKFILAGGTESMSNIPLIYGAKMTELFAKLMRCKTTLDKLKVCASFRPSFLSPIIGIQVGLTDPYCGLNMGQTAEVLAREFTIHREEQDAYALRSHQLSVEAQKSGFYDGEIHPLGAPPQYEPITQDEGPMAAQSLEKLAKLKPYFDRQCGTVTVGNACPVTDGAAMVLLCTEETAKERGLSVMGYLRDWSYAGLDGARMGLGPAYSTARLLQSEKYSLKDFGRIEINEAFAAQVMGNERAFASAEFAQKYLQRNTALGELPRDKTNVNGGAIALGHPVGTTGTRLIITLLRELKRSKQNLGLATLCIGGGQGASLVLEVDS